ncbi:MAG: Ezrin/radixin/moesin family protein [Cyclobacteriaceae bacterium]|nr:Ezrin/radixin/moesin family protein [Cyclobacteriaceae bacterium HetDA_MAG_MS6]
MKRFAALFLIIFCVALTFEATAQMSKKEAKEWKKRIKALKPEQYKTLLDENKSLKGQMSSLKQQVSGVDDRIADKDDQISQLQSQVASLRDQLAEEKAKPAAPAGPAIGGNINDQEGIVFKVQIGAFKNKDLSKYLDAGDNFSGEVDENGLKRYSLGVFRDYWEADTFKKYLREMGVKDAWIVSFKDGSRVPIKEVLENVSKS